MGKIISLTTEDLKKDLLTIADASKKYAEFVQKNIDSSEDITYKAYLPFIALIDICDEDELVEAVGRYIVVNQVLLENDGCLKSIKNTLENLIKAMDNMELVKIEKESLS